MKFLEDPMQTMCAGFALALVLIVLYLGMTGIGAGEVDWTGIVIRWIHFLAGITWIGLLYFFFVRQLRQAGRGAMSFGKSKAKLLTRDREKITFSDVAIVSVAENRVGFGNRR